MIGTPHLWMQLLITLGIAFVISFAATPIVKLFAQKVGAMDVPGEARRVHDHPIPRMGGLAIFLGFIIAVILFADIDRQVQGILLGAVLIVVIGAIDDVVSLNAWVKFGFQFLAAFIAVYHGVVIEAFTSPFLFSGDQYLFLNWLRIPITVIWIVGITNSVNLIDGLDGLACGVSTISSVTMLVVAMAVSEGNVAVILAALVGGCIGFIPYNLNPAKIFMGDTGALLLGYVLSTMSVLGLFKFYAVVTFAVPLLALAVPLVDTLFAFCRRLIHGQSPMHPDRGHFHHRLIDMGLSQKQAVAVLYAASAILGLTAVVIATDTPFKFLLLLVAFCIAVIVGVSLNRAIRAQRLHQAEKHMEQAARAESEAKEETKDA